MKLRKYIQFFLGTSIFLDLFYIYGVAGSLETDCITMRQAMARSIIACTYLAITVITYNRIGRSEKEIEKEYKIANYRAGNRSQQLMHETKSS